MKGKDIKINEAEMDERELTMYYGMSHSTRGDSILIENCRECLEVYFNEVEYDSVYFLGCTFLPGHYFVR